MLSCSIQLLLKTEDFLAAWRAFDMYMDPTNRIIGELEYFLKFKHIFKNSNLFEFK